MSSGRQLEAGGQALDDGREAGAVRLPGGCEAEATCGPTPYRRGPRRVDGRSAERERRSARLRRPRDRAVRRRRVDCG